MTRYVFSKFFFIRSLLQFIQHKYIKLDWNVLLENESSILQRFSVKMRRNCINKYMSRRAIYMQPSGLLHMKSNRIFQSKTFLHYEIFMSRILIFIEISLMAVCVVFRFLLVFGNTEFKVSKWYHFSALVWQGWW